MNTHKHHDCDEADDKIIRDVATFGWHVVMIEATKYLPSFAYTIGLWKNYNHPEIISFGLTVKTLCLVLNIAGEEIKKGGAYSINKTYTDLFKNSDAQFVPVDPKSIRDYFGYAIWFNNTADFPALQLIWTDRNNKFPWADNYEEEFVYRQPLLDRNANFKFREAKNLAIFTTKQWIKGAPILRVVHHEDGDWQFLTGDQMPEDISVVCLEEILLRDLTLNDVFDLDYGMYAERTDIGAKWERGETDTEEE